MDTEFRYVDKIFTKGRKYKRLVIKHEKGITEIPYKYGIHVRLENRHLFTVSKIDCYLVGYHVRVRDKCKDFVIIELIDAYPRGD